MKKKLMMQKWEMIQISNKFKIIICNLYLPIYLASYLFASLEFSQYFCHWIWVWMFLDWLNFSAL